MINRHVLLSLRLGALMLGVSASLAYAGKIETVGQFASGESVVAMLDGESIFFADAYRAKLIDAQLDTAGNSGTWGRVRHTIHSPTLARMEYVYTKDGRTVRRVYHARSGPAMEVVLSRYDFSPSTDASASESSATESEGSRPYEISEEDIAKDFAERVYYPADTPFNVRVPNLPLRSDSVIQSRLVGGKDTHKADAELKIFRQIEADINDGIVTRGGKLTGYVSKAMCESCGPASEDLAEHFDINGTIQQLVERDTNTVALDPALEASHKSSEALKNSRKAYASKHFRRNAVTEPGTRSWIDLDSIQALEAEEAGTKVIEPCGD
jgi:hypothetical protein